MKDFLSTKKGKIIVGVVSGIIVILCVLGMLAAFGVFSGESEKDPTGGEGLIIGDPEDLDEDEDAGMDFSDFEEDTDEGNKDDNTVDDKKDDDKKDDDKKDDDKKDDDKKDDDKKDDDKKDDDKKDDDKNNSTLDKDESNIDGNWSPLF